MQSTAKFATSALPGSEWIVRWRLVISMLLGYISSNASGGTYD